MHAKRWLCALPTWAEGGDTGLIDSASLQDLFGAVPCGIVPEHLIIIVIFLARLPPGDAHWCL